MTRPDESTLKRLAEHLFQYDGGDFKDMLQRLREFNWGADTVSDQAPIGVPTVPRQSEATIRTVATALCTRLRGRARGLDYDGLVKELTVYRGRNIATVAHNLLDTLPGLENDPVGASIIGDTLREFNWEGQQPAARTVPRQTSAHITQVAEALFARLPHMFQSVNAIRRDLSAVAGQSADVAGCSLCSIVTPADARRVIGDVLREFNWDGETLALPGTPENIPARKNDRADLILQFAMHAPGPELPMSYFKPQPGWGDCQRERDDFCMARWHYAEAMVRNMPTSVGGER